MKAYAVRMAGLFFLVNAPTHAKAKGHAIRCAHAAGVRSFADLACRRWPLFDDDDPRERIEEWGIPGARDYESGARIEMPCPFKGAAA